MLVVGIAAYLVMSGGGGGNGTSASQSPSPTASESPSPTTSPTPGNGGTDVAGASSLQFSVSLTEEGMVTYDVST